MTAKLRKRLSLEVANLQEATALIVERHYLHRGRTMAQMPYWITLDGKRVGVLLFALPRLSVTYQGHRPMNLIELARMWIDPDAQGQRVTDSNGQEHTFALATCAIGMALRQIRQDWHGKYPHLPMIEACVSWADDVHHEGTVYRAANFKEVGKSGGSLHGNAQRSNGGRDQLHDDYRHIKTAFIHRYRRSLSEKQMAKARTVWADVRPRLSRNQRLKLEGAAQQLALAGLETESRRAESHAP
ncbi:MAG: DUF4338 domain-containing protein [bacterium]|nr:DUF4338 domain-containing protein [bacterium]